MGNYVRAGDPPRIPEKAEMTNPPAILTVAQVISSRRGVNGLHYRGCAVKFIDRQPAHDGTYHTVTTDESEYFLKPETWLEVESNVGTEATTQ